MKKKIWITGIAIILFLLILGILNVVNAETYLDTEQNIEWSYDLDQSGNVINLRCKTTTVTGGVTIPSMIDDKKVISLGDHTWQANGAFENCRGLSAITIPDTIKTIGEKAFSNCTGLKSVTIPNSVTSISSSCFENCSGITTITLSENLTAIGSYAFEYCTGLKKVIIPNKVTSMGEAAFQNCSGLKEVTISNNLSKISPKTFAGCTGLTSVILPNSVTTLGGGGYSGYGAFSGCTRLEKILIPDSVASIGANVFHGCSKLTIYGNDDQVSKSYAEENKIKFDYIKNWDKPASGSDITSPTVKNIMVTYSSIMDYKKDSITKQYMIPTDAKIVINVNFSEKIKGSTVPTLSIKFGEGQNIQLTEGTISNATISYIYTIKSTDKGVLSTVEFSGGNITDEAGNAATLSCPAIEVQYGTGDAIYANGTVTNINNGNSSNGTNNGNNSSSSGSSSNNSSATGTSGKKDNTTASGKIPQTGIYSGIIIGIIVIAGISYISYRKYRNLKGI